MNKTVLFNFLVDKELNRINVERAFDAPLSIVWAAWTQAEILDQWWAPEPYRTVTASLNFTEGGRWHYYMLGPEGDIHWCLFDYEIIQPLRSFSGIDAFCDAHAVPNETKPKVRWANRFDPEAETTIVRIQLQFDSPNDLEQILQMGFREGFTMGLDNLERYLAAQKNAHAKITVQASIAADRQRVWDYYTTPAHITRWNFATEDWCCPSASNDMRVGGTYHARMESKDGSFGFDFEAIYDAVRDGESFTYTMIDGRRADVVFETSGKHTKVTVTFDPESQNPVDLQRDGWQAILNNFKEYVEKS